VICLSRLVSCLQVVCLLASSELLCLHAEMIRDFMQNVFWSDRDFLIIDTPPGTSDEHISVIQNLRSYNPDGAILVTTPQVGYRKLDCLSLEECSCLLSGGSHSASDSRFSRRCVHYNLNCYMIIYYYYY